MTDLIRDRVVELRRVQAGSLLPNPRNWRIHPPAQTTAVRSILETVGYADAVLARETPDGLELLDGHLRRDLTPDAVVPVLVLDLTDDEADLILATHDPLAAMAGTDEIALAALIEALEIPDADLAMLLTDLAGVVPTFAPLDEADDVRLDQRDPTTCPNCGYEWRVGAAGAVDPV